MLKGVAQPGIVEIAAGSLLLRAGPVDAMAAQILEFTAQQWPKQTVGAIAAALQDALFWQKIIYSLVEIGEGKEQRP